jgi:hypothetical protein
MGTIIQQHGIYPKCNPIVATKSTGAFRFPLYAKGLLRGQRICIPQTKSVSKLVFRKCLYALRKSERKRRGIFVTKVSGSKTCGFGHNLSHSAQLVIAFVELFDALRIKWVLTDSGGFRGTRKKKAALRIRRRVEEPFQDYLPPASVALVWVDIASGEREAALPGATSGRAAPIAVPSLVGLC